MTCFLKVIIINAVLVTCVFGQCIEQQFRLAENIQISVNVPADGNFTEYYILCPTTEDEIFGTFGNITCSEKTKRCSVTQVLPFQQENVINILSYLFSKNVTFSKFICKRKTDMRDGLLNLNNHDVPGQDGYFFDKETNYLAAWNTSYFRYQRYVIVYQGPVDKLLLSNGSTFVTFYYKNNNYTVGLNESTESEKLINQNIQVKSVNSSDVKIKPRDLVFIKRINLNIPFCEGSFLCRRFTDIEPTQDIPFYISLFFNCLEVVVIGCLSIFIWRYWKQEKYSKMIHKHPTVPTVSNGIPNGTPFKITNGKLVREKPQPVQQRQYSEYSEQLSAPPLPPPRSENMRSGGSYLDPTEFHEYFTVGSNVPKRYAVLNKVGEITIPDDESVYSKIGTPASKYDSEDYRPVTPLPVDDQSTTL